MILKKRNTQTARWDKENNKWLVGTLEYQWFHEKSKEQSPWTNLDDALIWIKERDQKKFSIQKSRILEKFPSPVGTESVT